MSTVVACTDCGSISNFTDIGFGKVFNQLKDFFYKEVGELRETETLGRPNDVIQSLNEIFEECSEEGWDGYNALPITEDAYREAKSLIKSLPLTPFPMPEITPGPKGEVNLGWYREKRFVFIASVSGKRKIIYAGLFGVNKAHGEVCLDDSLPSVIIQNLNRLYRD